MQMKQNFNQYIQKHLNHTLQYILLEYAITDNYFKCYPSPLQTLQIHIRCKKLNLKT